jgi:hypothetical protein
MQGAKCRALVQRAKQSVVDGGLPIGTHELFMNLREYEAVPGLRKGDKLLRSSEV